MKYYCIYVDINSVDDLYNNLYRLGYSRLCNKNELKKEHFTRFVDKYNSRYFILDMDNKVIIAETKYEKYIPNGATKITIEDLTKDEVKYISEVRCIKTYDDESITTGRKYNVIKEDFDSYLIENNMGKICWYKTYCFVKIRNNTPKKKFIS